jgi:hypothetical protein
MVDRQECTQAVKEGQVEAAGPWRQLCKISHAKTRSNTSEDRRMYVLYIYI